MMTFVIMMLAGGLITSLLGYKSPEQLQVVREAIARQSATPVPMPTPPRPTPRPTPRPQPTPHTSWKSYLAAHPAPFAKGRISATAATSS
jgi:hypothetical protein